MVVIVSTNQLFGLITRGLICRRQLRATSDSSVLRGQKPRRCLLALRGGGGNTHLWITPKLSLISTSSGLLGLITSKKIFSSASKSTSRRPFSGVMASLLCGTSPWRYGTPRAAWSPSSKTQRSSRPACVQVRSSPVIQAKEVCDRCFGPPRVHNRL